jgi:hypothetical protein
MKKIFLLVILLFFGRCIYSQIPNPPTLLSPPNNSTGVNPDSVKLDWTDVSGALSYRVLVSLNSSFNALVIDENTTNSQYSIQPGILSSNTLYFWHANVTTTGGTSNWSSTFKFTTGQGNPHAPILLIPINGQTGVPIHPTFDWNSVPGATDYILQISKSSLFDSLVVCDTTPLSPITLEYNMIYYWRVCAINNGNTGNWSSVWHFTTIIEQTPPPVLLYPCGVVAPLPVTLDWTDVSSATSYRVQVSTSSTFSSFLIDNVATVSQYTIPLNVLNYSSAYYWRVASINAGGVGTYSTPCSFTTQNSSVVKKISSEIPSEYKLYNNYPNPFNPSTNIKYQIKAEVSSQYSEVRIIIYDILGKEIEKLVNEKQSPGTYEINFDGSNLSNGIYFYTLRSGDFTDTKKMVLMK